jgi:hypothetical protein
MTEKSTSMRTLTLRERQRVAAEDEAKAIAEYKAAGIAIRENMISSPHLASGARG